LTSTSLTPYYPFALLSLAPCPAILCIPRICQSFFRYNSFKNPVAAADVVFAASALLELYRSDASDSGNDGAEVFIPGNGTDAAGAAFGASGSGSGGSSGVSRLTAFNEAYDCLGMKAEELLKKGLQSAITLQKVKTTYTSRRIYRNFIYSSTDEV
jgi:hypothetical protein